MSKENWNNFVFTWAFWQTDTPRSRTRIQFTHIIYGHTQTAKTTSSLLHPETGSGLQPWHTCHCPSHVCPPETDYFDQSAKWLDQLGTLKRESTAACRSLKTSGPIRTASLGLWTPPKTTPQRQRQRTRGVKDGRERSESETKEA